MTDVDPGGVNPLEHSNIFRSEADFLVHYDRARIIARDPRNHVRKCDGEDILGVPRYVGEPMPDVDGVEKLGPAPLPLPGRQVLRGPNGAVIWRTPPRSGWATEADMVWYPVPFLAPHLQTTLISPDEKLHLRVTPEVRIERGVASELRIRTLSIELSLIDVRQIGTEMVDAFRDSQIRLVRMWFPLHVDVQAETLTSTPGPARGRVPVTNLLFRFRATHDTIDLTA